MEQSNTLTTWKHLVWCLYAKSFPTADSVLKELAISNEYKYNKKHCYTIEIPLPFWHHWPCPTEPSLNLFHLTSGKTEKERHQNFATRDRHKKLN